jgi:hypothetical protein
VDVVVVDALPVEAVDVTGVLGLADAVVCGVFVEVRLDGLAELAVPVTAVEFWTLPDPRVSTLPAGWVAPDEEWPVPEVAVVPGPVPAPETLDPEVGPELLGARSPELDVRPEFAGGSVRSDAAPVPDAPPASWSPRCGIVPAVPAPAPAAVGRGLVVTSGGTVTTMGADEIARVRGPVAEVMLPGACVALLVAGRSVAGTRSAPPSVARAQPATSSATVTSEAIFARSARDRRRGRGGRLGCTA